MDRGGAAVCSSHCQFGITVRPGRLEILDIDDTFCAAHGCQQLAFWNAHYDERGFAPMHIYHVASGTPVVAILRPARTAKGTEVRCVIKPRDQTPAQTLAEHEAEMDLSEIGKAEISAVAGTCTRAGSLHFASSPIDFLIVNCEGVPGRRNGKYSASIKGFAGLGRQ
jgi:hypothetical protein